MALRTFFFVLLLLVIESVEQSMTDTNINSNDNNQRYGIMTNTDSICGSQVCRNGAQCIWTGMNYYRCQCDSVGYWLGSDCSIPNPCIANPCNNRGQCYFWPNATYYCVCYPNFIGSNCQYTSASNTNTNHNNNICLTHYPCLNGGTCLPAASPNQYTCQCLANYIGPNCQWINSFPEPIATVTSAPSVVTAATSTSGTSDCGISQLKSSVDYDRIVNGQSVYTYTWPWLVSLQTSSGAHFCGGTLVDSLHVITAAHCFDTMGTTPNLFKVVAGILNLQQLNSNNVQQLTIDRIFRHERYSNTVLNNDIAVIKLRIPSKITSNVSPICLPSADGKQDPTIGKNVQIAGWGYTNSATQQIASQLQQATIQILDINDDLSGKPGCSSWTRRGYPVTASQQICAMSRDTRTDSCQGDSGGPLIRDVGSRWYLFGIVSYGDTICASSTAAGVYTRVSGYMPWIQQKLQL